MAAHRDVVERILGADQCLTRETGFLQHEAHPLSDAAVVADEHTECVDDSSGILTMNLSDVGGDGFTGPRTASRISGLPLLRTASDCSVIAFQ
jgi:hypothetical protein